MNTTNKGAELEKEIYEFLISKINNGNFLARPECCKIYRQKAYYSKDRESNIIFDVAIEIYLPNSENYSILILVECKNYKYAVGVEDLEEFFAKTQQVAAANSKAILVTRSAFQKGARNFAKSKGIALLRYFDQNDFEWVLHRTMSQNPLSREIRNIEEALNNSSFVSIYHRIYIQTPYRLSHSILDIFKDFFLSVVDCNELLNLLILVAPNEKKLLVPYHSKAFIKAKTIKILKSIGYVEGKVSLETVCTTKSLIGNLKVLESPPNLELPHVLGEIVFKENTIHLFHDHNTNESQKRFSLAHELGHYFLNHGKYIAKEQLTKVEIDNFHINLNDFDDLARLEFQANYFAASLLMPDDIVKLIFVSLIKVYKIKNRGFAHLFLDEQICNINNYFSITNFMMEYFGVSRAAIAHKLEELELLVKR